MSSDPAARLADAALIMAARSAAVTDLLQVERQEHQEQAAMAKALIQSLHGDRASLEQQVATLGAEVASLREALTALVAAVNDGPYIDGCPLVDWLEPRDVTAKARGALAPASREPTK